MLTDRQRARCREIAAALDRHDQGPWLKAEPSLGPEARGLIWDLRAHVVAAGGRSKKTENLTVNSSSGLAKPDAAVMRDLDFWSDTEPEPDDDDDGDVPCAACNGRGRDATGNVCQACNGTGVAPDDDDDRDEDDENGEDD